MGIRESLLNTITSVGNGDFIRIVTSAGASSKATLANVFKSFESGLGAKSNLTNSDYLRVVGSDNNAYKQSVSSVADAIIPTLAKVASNGTDTETMETIGCYYGGNWINGPSGVAASGYLIVLPHGTAAENYRKQLYMPYSSSEIYVRTKATNWNAWSKQPTRAEIDALNSKTTPISTTLTGCGKPWTFYKFGRLVLVEAPNDLSSANSGFNTLGTLPEEYRPARQVYFGVANDNVKRFLVVRTDGVVQFYTGTAITAAVNGGVSGTYISAN